MYVEEILYKEGLLFEGEFLFVVGNILFLYYINVVFCVYKLYVKDVDYIVKDE